MACESGLNMKRMGGFDVFLKLLICIIAVFPILNTVCVRGELSETESFLSFIRSIDPQNKLGTRSNDLSRNPCSYKPEGVKCDLHGTSIVEIRLENLNLSGVIDADALCKLQNLEVLSLARNLIHGTIPSSISCCTRLRYLNLSSNCLSGRVPWSLSKMQYLESLDISNNHFSPFGPRIKLEFKHIHKYSAEPIAVQRDSHLNTIRLDEKVAASPRESKNNDSNNLLVIVLPIFLVIGLLCVFLYYYMRISANQEAKEEQKQKALKESPVNGTQQVKPGVDKHQELVFFVEDRERFKLDDLLEASADLRKQSLRSSLYKVILRNNATYAVKRLKNLQVSFEEFGLTMRRIGNMKHRNILPLVGYNCTNEEKLLFYKYQTNGSLQNLLQGYIEGKREFPWRLRLTIARGIAKGLAFIYPSSNDQDMIIPHGNLKLSNILLGENMEPLISEYGVSRLLEPQKHNLYASNGYFTPQKSSLSEQGDVFSFGVILLELLTGKTVEKTGVDLPQWVRSMVREEWTGEVFDKEVNKAALQWAYPLLKIALKCVSHSPQDRPTASEVSEKIEEALFAYEDRSVSSLSSMESGHGHPDCCILHSVIPETWDTPGSNY
ncbi:hypothetical protein PTKIN_Ptkin14bG0030800 [Pterospermum kingtungense]